LIEEKNENGYSKNRLFKRMTYIFLFLYFAGRRMTRGAEGTPTNAVRTPPAPEKLRPEPEGRREQFLEQLLEQFFYTTDTV